MTFRLSVTFQQFLTVWKGNVDLPTQQRWWSTRSKHSKPHPSISSGTHSFHVQPQFYAWCVLPRLGPVHVDSSKAIGIQLIQAPCTPRFGDSQVQTQQASCAADPTKTERSNVAR